MKRFDVIKTGAVLLAVSFVIQGCSSTPPPRPAPVIEQGQVGTAPRPADAPAVKSPVEVYTPAEASNKQSPAVVALLESAEQQANAGNLESAAASLERAIRIDPNNPVLWYHLATVRLEQGDSVQAEQLAVKSNRLAAGSHGQQARNWQLIAKARAARNDAAGASAARQRARQLELR